MDLIPTKKIIRIISGGCQTDFNIEDLEKAHEFFKRKVKYWTYASMRIICIFKKKEEKNMGEELTEEEMKEEEKFQETLENSKKE